MKSENQTNLCAWDEVKRKLLDALDVIEHDGILVSQAVECENNSTENPLSLYAISEAPRLRLLWATLQRLQKEAGTVSNASLFFYMISFFFILGGVSRGVHDQFRTHWWHYELPLHTNMSLCDLSSRFLLPCNLHVFPTFSHSILVDT